MATMRIDKFLSHVGVGTRTEVKKLIKQKKVKINDCVINDPGIKVNETSDQVSVCGEPVRYQEFVYLMLNKPKGVISATEDKRDKTVIDLIDHPMKSKLFPVGRLDKDTTGLLLLTNDGDLSHQLLSPKKHIDKTYFALIEGSITDETIRAFKEGLRLEDGYECMSASLTLIKEDAIYQSKGQSPQVLNMWDDDKDFVSITIKEGKFHQIKRMFEAVDMKVVELYRYQMGSLILDSDLELGQYRELDYKELNELKTGDKKNV